MSDEQTMVPDIAKLVAGCITGALAARPPLVLVVKTPVGVRVVTDVPAVVYLVEPMKVPAITRLTDDHICAGGAVARELDELGVHHVDGEPVVVRRQEPAPRDTST